MHVSVSNVSIYHIVMVTCDRVYCGQGVFTPPAEVVSHTLLMLYKNIVTVVLRMIF